MDSTFGMGDGFGPPAGFSFMFTLVPVLIGIVFVIVIVTMIARGVRYAQNARSPRESVYARIVSKRMEVHQSSGHSHGTDNQFHTSGSSRTDYYITLEFENGERKEFLDVKKLYGLVAEGDVGYAQTQGEWIVAFERT
ncbi:DUF2500 domain-containing protein [Paenibacillus albicereus]|nr:DUF2500 domain-containing protein [Paenibacillus albicereus]